MSSYFLYRNNFFYPQGTFSLGMTICFTRVPALLRGPEIKLHF